MEFAFLKIFRHLYLNGNQWGVGRFSGTNSIPADTGTEVVPITVGNFSN